jgi:hypothetical protein
MAGTALFGVAFLLAFTPPPGWYHLSAIFAGAETDGAGRGRVLLEKPSEAEASGGANGLPGRLVQLAHQPFLAVVALAIALACLVHVVVRNRRALLPLNSSASDQEKASSSVVPGLAMLLSSKQHRH